MAEYIEREKIVYPFLHVRLWGVNESTRRAHNEGVKAVKDNIESMPAADVTPVVHGTWEERDDGWGGTYYHCSACGEDWCIIEGTPDENNWNYCPHCGAKMDQEG